jgi:hypothetical protein
MGDDLRTVKQAIFAPTEGNPRRTCALRAFWSRPWPPGPGGSVASHQADDDSLDLHVLLASPNRREFLV